VGQASKLNANKGLTHNRTDDMGHHCAECSGVGASLATTESPAIARDHQAPEQQVAPAGCVCGIARAHMPACDENELNGAVFRSCGWPVDQRLREVCMRKKPGGKVGTEPTGPRATRAPGPWGGRGRGSLQS
jgi:hypothetical protein